MLLSNQLLLTLFSYHILSPVDQMATPMNPLITAILSSANQMATPINPLVATILPPASQMATPTVNPVIATVLPAANQMVTPMNQIATATDQNLLHNSGKNTSVNMLTDDTIKLLIDLIAKCNLSSPKASTRPPSNIPPSNLPVPPPPNAPIPNESDTCMAFKDTTEEPYDPRIYVLEQLYLAIGGSGCPFSTQRHSVLEIAQLAARFLRNPKKKDLDLIKRVQALLEEVKRIAEECLGKNQGHDRNYFAPDIIWGLRLTRQLGRKVRVLSKEGHVTGELVAFVLPESAWETCSRCPYNYKIEIVLDQPVGDLHVIWVPIDAAELHKGSDGGLFLEDGSMDVDAKVGTSQSSDETESYENVELHGEKDGSSNGCP